MLKYLIAATLIVLKKIEPICSKWNLWFRLKNIQNKKKLKKKFKPFLSNYMF